MTIKTRIQLINLTGRWVCSIIVSDPTRPNGRHFLFSCVGNTLLANEAAQKSDVVATTRPKLETEWCEKIRSARFDETKNRKLAVFMTSREQNPQSGTSKVAVSASCYFQYDPGMCRSIINMKF
jgi:hypothetical protein